MANTNHKNSIKLGVAEGQALDAGSQETGPGDSDDMPDSIAVAATNAPPTETDKPEQSAADPATKAKAKPAATDAPSKAKPVASNALDQQDEEPPETEEKTWLSGDWSDPPRPDPPYSGLRITAKFADAPGSAVQVIFDDFTTDADGARSEIPKLKAQDGWVMAPMPEAPADAGKFTVDGAVRIFTDSTGRYLQIRLTYGPPDYRRAERGFVFSVG
jgi:hypothetical protein